MHDDAVQKLIRQADSLLEVGRPADALDLLSEAIRIEP
jgi:hypothetical protein